MKALQLQHNGLAAAKQQVSAVKHVLECSTQYHNSASSISQDCHQFQKVKLSPIPEDSVYRGRH